MGGDWGTRSSAAHTHGSDRGRERKVELEPGLGLGRNEWMKLRLHEGKARYRGPILARSDEPRRGGELRTK